jgi:uncharacterized protein (DUF1778 family)
MRTRPIVIACRVTEHERTVLEAAARLEQASLAEMVRKGALRGAIDRLRAVQPQENTKRELVEDVEDRAVA